MTVYMVDNNDSWGVNIKQDLQLDLLYLTLLYFRFKSNVGELILDVKSAYKVIGKRMYDTEKTKYVFAKLSNSDKCILNIYY